MPDHPRSHTESGDAGTVLVTGASGFIGGHVVRALLTAGFTVRALVRQEDDAERLVGMGAAAVTGDVRDVGSIEDAMAGAAAVVHAAADTSGTIEGGRTTTIEGTRNALLSAVGARVRRVVYISSCSVYSYLDKPTGAIIDEESDLEPHPEQRGPYSWAKTVADEEAGEIAALGSTIIVRLRPGLVYGPGADPTNPMVGVPLGRYFFVIDRPGLFLPLVHVEDLADAVVLALTNEMRESATFNVVSPERVDKATFIERVVRPRQTTHRRFVHVPYALFYSMVALVEVASRALRRHPPLTRYRLASSQRPVVISSERIIDELQWRPTRSVLDLPTGLHPVVRASKEKGPDSRATAPGR